MITLTAGVTGSGKTYRNVGEMLRTLEHTNRLIVTNINELIPGEWQALLDERANERSLKIHGKPSKWNDDINKRLFVIPRSETSHYYRFRGTKTYERFKTVKGRSIEENDRALEEYFTQFSNDGVGVAYYMDELHRHFRSERWDEISDAIMFHLAQHRHLDDEFNGMTQNPEQVAARFNRQVHEYYLMRNHYKEQFGIFSKPGCFKIHCYYYVPKTGDRAAQPFDVRTIRLDIKKLGKLYRTRGALGGTTTATETEQRRFRLHWSLIFVFALVAAVSAGAMIWGFLGAAKMGLNKLLGTPAKTAVSTPLPAPEPKRYHETPPTLKQSQAEPENDLPEPLTVVSVTQRPKAGKYTIRLSDGTILTEETGGFSRIERNSIVLKDGTRIFYKSVQAPTPRKAEGRRGGD